MPHSDRKATPSTLKKWPPKRLRPLALKSGMLLMPATPSTNATTPLFKRVTPPCDGNSGLSANACGVSSGNMHLTKTICSLMAQVGQHMALRSLQMHWRKMVSPYPRVSRFWNSKQTPHVSSAPFRTSLILTAAISISRSIHHVAITASLVWPAGSSTLSGMISASPFRKWEREKYSPPFAGPNPLAAALFAMPSRRRKLGVTVPPRRTCLCTARSA
eukprot:9416188-Lingulodinium_polyedra.AAC.2